MRVKFGRSPILSMRYSSNDQYVAFSQEKGVITIFDDIKGILIFHFTNLNIVFLKKTGIAQQTIREESACNSLRWTPIENRNDILEGYANGCIRYRTIKRNFSNKILTSFKLPTTPQSPSPSVNCVEFHPSGCSFLTGGSDAIVAHYDLVTGKKTASFSHHKNRVFAVKTMDASSFLSAGWDHTVFLFDMRAKKV